MSFLFGSFEQSSRLAVKRWGWFFGLGLLLICLGMLAFVFATASTSLAIVTIGVGMIAVGMLQLAVISQWRGRLHIVLFLIPGALDIAIGIGIVRLAEVGALMITLLVASYLAISGLLRLLYGFWPRGGNISVVFSGALSAALGVLLLLQWPYLAPWCIGFVLSINLILIGVSWTSIALALRTIASLPSA